MKKYTGPANEFLLRTHKAIGKRNINKCILKKCTRPADEFHLQTGGHTFTPSPPLPYPLPRL